MPKFCPNGIFLILHSIACSVARIDVKIQFFTIHVVIRYETNGVLAGVFEWYQGVDFITCVKESAKPLSLNYIKGNSIIEVAYDSGEYYIPHN